MSVVEGAHFAGTLHCKGLAICGDLALQGAQL